MNHALAALLPSLMPAAVAWVEREAEDIVRTGLPLTEAGLSLALRVGVLNPERVRLKFVSVIPKPDTPALRQAVELGGFFGPDTAGLTLGYGIYIREGTLSSRLLSHELRHVHQYEVAGSVARYIPAYLGQIVQYGYENSPFEVDARANEIEV